MEVLRRTESDEFGRLYDVVEEFAVIDQVGRLQLPSEFVAELQLRDRVRVQLGSDHVQIRSGHSDDEHREARARTHLNERASTGKHQGPSDSSVETSGPNEISKSPASSSHTTESEPGK